MSFSIEAIGPERLADYASVPNVIEVKSIFVVEEIDRGAGRFELHEQPVPVPYLKDYDTYAHVRRSTGPGDSTFQSGESGLPVIAVTQLGQPQSRTVDAVPTSSNRRTVQPCFGIFECDPRVSDNTSRRPCFKRWSRGRSPTAAQHWRSKRRM